MFDAILMLIDYRQNFGLAKMINKSKNLLKSPSFPLITRRKEGDQLINNK